MQKTLVLKVTAGSASNDYMIKVPTAGQILEIENIKASLSLYYREIADKKTILGDLSLDIIDMTAYFTVLCPDLINDLTVPIAKMDLSDLLILRKNVFFDQFTPWWSEWIQLINAVPEMKVSTPTEDLGPKNDVDIDLG